VVRRRRLVGALAASGICALVSIALLMAGATVPSATGTWLRGPLLAGALWAGVGVTVGWYLGWTRAEDALSARRASEVVVAISWRAVILGAALIAIALAAGSARWPAPVPAVTLDRLGEVVLAPLGSIAFLFGLAFICGIAVFGLPVLLVTAPLVAIWRLIVRWPIPSPG
jgi:hypothetical protein